MLLISHRLVPWQSSSSSNLQKHAGFSACLIEATRVSANSKVCVHAPAECSMLSSSVSHFHLEACLEGCRGITCVKRHKTERYWPRIRYLLIQLSREVWSATDKQAMLHLMPLTTLIALPQAPAFGIASRLRSRDSDLLLWATKGLLSRCTCSLSVKWGVHCSVKSLTRYSLAFDFQKSTGYRLGNGHLLTWILTWAVAKTLWKFSAFARLMLIADASFGPIQIKRLQAKAESLMLAKDSCTSATCSLFKSFRGLSQCSQFIFPTSILD